MKEELPRKEKKEKVQWDKLKIALFSILVFLLLFAGYQLKTLTLDNQDSNASFKTDVKGTSTFNPATPSLKESIQKNVEDLKNEAGNINVAELATSSPQVQKVINDLRQLQNLPQSGLKNTCFRICNGL